MLKDLDKSLDLVFCFKIEDSVLIARLLDRAKKEGRVDDNFEVIQKRIETYKDETYPLVEYYQNLGLLHSIQADSSVTQVTQSIQSHVSSLS